MTARVVERIDYAGALAKHQVRAHHADDSDASAYAGKIPKLRARPTRRKMFAGAPPAVLAPARHDRPRLEGRRAPLYQGPDSQRSDACTSLLGLRRRFTHWLSLPG